MSAPQFWRRPTASSSSTSAAIPSVSAIRKSLPSFPSPALRVSRVGQLDAALLDHELEGILGGPLWKALEELRRPGSGSGNGSWEAEWMVLLRFTILRMSLFDRGATYGATLQNLKYRNEWAHSAGLQSTAVDSSLTPVQLNTYTLLSVLPSYLHTRLQDTMLSSSWSDYPLPQSYFSLLNLRRLSAARHRADTLSPSRTTLPSEWKRLIWESTRLSEKVGQIAGLINFLVFLYDGRYRTMVDRVLGMRLIYDKREVSRNVSFEFLNRQLVWEAFTEFLLFLMPLINLHKLRLRALKFLSKTSSKSKSLTALFTTLPLPLLRLLGLPARSPSPRTTTTTTKDGKKAKVEEKIDPTVRPMGVYGFLSDGVCPICYSLSSAAENIPTPPTSLPSSSLNSITSSSPTSTSTPIGTSTGREGGEDTKVKVAYTTNCGWDCRYCYYCIVGKLLVTEEEGDGEAGWECLRCGGEVTEVSREKDEVMPMREIVALEQDAAELSDKDLDDEEEEEVGEEHDNWR